MTPELVTVIALVVFLALMAARVPVGFSLAIGGTVGIVMLDGFGVASATLGSIPFASSAKYTFLVIPLFVFMGVLIAETGIAQEIYGFANRALGKIPGGLGLATVMACAMLSAVSGSTSATSATIGRVSIREMTRHGYAAPFSAALVAVAGTLAVIIPPSIALVMYGIFTGESIGKLFIAAIVPSAISAGALAIYVIVWTAIRNARQRRRLARADTGSEASAQASTEPPVAIKTGRFAGLSGLAYVTILFGVVMGGIYTGVFTATEAAAVGALGALLLGLIQLRKSRGVTRKLATSLRETATTTGMIFGILLGGGVFTVFLVTTQVPQRFTDWVVSLPVPPAVVMICIILAMLPLGMVLDGLSMMVITIPLTYPVVTALGYDGIWFGVIVVIAFEIGLITPPVGLNVFVIAGLEGSPSAERIFSSAIGFVLLQLGIIALLFLVPELVTWLPSLMSS